MSLKNTATRVAALDTLKRRVSEELDAARLELQAQLTAAKDDTGTEQIGFGLDGVDIGKATLVQPDDAVVVTDEDALLAWVRTVAPTEITSRVVTEIRPAWRAMLLKQLSSSGQLVWADVETGEIHEVPGVELQAKPAHVRVTVPAAGKVVLAEAWRSRAVWRLALPELTAGEE